MKINSFYISPWSLADPLCQSQSLAYIDQLITHGYTFALLTFENTGFALTDKDLLKKKKELKKKGIYWYPVYWKSGNSVFDKILSIFLLVFTGIKICFKHRPQLIHSRSSLPTFLAVFLSKLFDIKYLYDADSILSEEYAETNHLSRRSWGFKLLVWSESLARKRAEQIIVLTEKLKEDFRQIYQVKCPIEVIPCCVDTEKFKFNPEARIKRRNELGLNDERLLVYVGKIGSWYLVEEMLDFFKTVLQVDISSKLLIVTNEKREVFEDLLKKKNISQSAYFLKQALHFEVTEWLSASDVGLAFIKPLPSKRGSSPIKTSEYLANGLPIVSNIGIGDLDTIIENGNVGFIVTEFNENCYEVMRREINNLLKDKRFRKYSRDTACKYFDLEKVGGMKYRRIYQKLLSQH